ncbi:hypothetical protein BOO71_0006667 [Deinococcus marmoris]|uniref:Uncharacterized protein n=1 Tax=Deinococcus marmoris TaxID=249408 RepID=A0A1U7NZ12_9DEIO|nr:hypothetical protein BOO71_0006667 [Deinococcus marmoris]
MLAKQQDAPKQTETTFQRLNPPEINSRQTLKNPAAYALPPQRKGRRGDEGGPKRTDVPREQLNVRIRPELKRAAGLAGLQGMTLGDVVEAALIEYLKAAQQEERSGYEGPLAD